MECLISESSDASVSRLNRKACRGFVLLRFWWSEGKQMVIVMEATVVCEMLANFLESKFVRNNLSLAWRAVEDWSAYKVSMLNPRAVRAAAIDNVAVTYAGAVVVADSTKTNNFQCTKAYKEPTGLAAKPIALNPILLACSRTCHLSKSPQKMIETCFVLAWSFNFKTQSTTDRLLSCETQFYTRRGPSFSASPFIHLWSLFPLLVCMFLLPPLQLTSKENSLSNVTRNEWERRIEMNTRTSDPRSFTQSRSDSNSFPACLLFVSLWVIFYLLLCVPLHLSGINSY